MKYVTSQKMREIDKRAIEEFGIPSIILMENAGYRASCIALDMLSETKAKKVVCVCGKGNNGGDGFVCARHLINNGVDTDIFLVGEPSRLTGDAKINYNILKKLKARVVILEVQDDFGFFENSLKKTSLLIDAIFGIGLSGRVKEPYRKVIDLMNQSKIPILAIDVPSGLDATEGNMLGVCIKAKKTVTFALPKTGFFKNHGPLHVGELITVDISIPDKLLK